MFAPPGCPRLQAFDPAEECPTGVLAEGELGVHFGVHQVLESTEGTLFQFQGVDLGRG